MRVMSASSSFLSTAVGADGGDIARGGDCGRAREIDTASRVGDARGARARRIGGERSSAMSRSADEASGSGRSPREREGDGDARGGAELENFVVARYLRRRGGAFGELAREFERLAREDGSFPSRVDVFGGTHEATFEDLASGAFAGLPEDALERALSNALASARGRLDFGKRRDDEDGRVVRARRMNPVGALRRAMTRETSGTGARAVAETKTVAKNMNCLRTLRAHRDAAYCAVLSKSGRRLVTGGDDRLVKIWCVHNGLLQSACRGHVGEITYVAIDSRERVVASSSTDTSIRTWDLETGAPIAVLLGHTSSITELHFCPAVPHILLSTAEDGTVRLWSAVRSSNDVKPMVIDYANGTGTVTGGRVVEHDVMPLASMTNDATSPGMRTRGARLDVIAADEENESGEEGGTVGRPNNRDTCQIVCGAFNHTGDVFAVGTSTCKVFMWKLDLDVLRESDDASPQEKAVKRISISGTHLNDVVSVNFSHSGNLLLSASKDGQARIWAPGSSDRPSWVLQTTLTTPEDAAALREQQRMACITSQQYSRRSPKVPNMHIAVWSSDDARVIASMGDQSIRVWDVASGTLQHAMREHTAATYVIQPNPLDPRLVMSASYDGKAVVWDIVEGVSLRVFDGSHYNTKLVDGNWHPDGTSIIVSDLSGQFSVFGTGESTRLLRAKYEQFFQTEFVGEDSLARSEGGHLIAIASGALLHEAYPRNLLCDAMGDPYPDPYQSAYQSGQVAACLPSADAGMADVIVQAPTLAELAPTDVQGPWTAVEEPPLVQDNVYHLSDDDALDEPGDDDDDFIEPSDESDDDYDSEHERRERAARSRNRRLRSRRRSRRFDSDESEYSDASEDRATRRSERTHRRPDRLGVDDYESASEEEGEQPTRITRRRRRELQELGIASDEDADSDESEERPVKRAKLTVKSRHDIRLLEAYSWLSVEEVTVGTYVPQLGDALVYVAQGHYERMQEMGKDWQDEAPWQTLTSMRFVEPCTVSSLRYVIAEETYETQCLLELKLIDPACGDYGKEFLVVLEKSDTPDFLVTLSRYQTAEQSAWRRGDLCAALWDDTGMGDVTPWYGMVDRVLKHEGEWSGSPWNALCIQYLNVQNIDDKFMDHSFWELYSDDAMRKEHAKSLAAASTSRGPRRPNYVGVDANSPALSSRHVKELSNRVQKVIRNPRFDAFCSVIGPNEKFSRADGVVTNYCSVVPLPMSLKLILHRLKSGYYRQIDGFRSDIELIRTNAQIFHGEESVFAKCAEELEDDLLDDLPTNERDFSLDGMKSYATIVRTDTGDAEENGTRPSLRVRMRR